LVLVCEDRQHETFARRFLGTAGWSTRRLRVEIAPPGRGAAEHFVRERFPIELSSYRTKRHQTGQALIAMVDGDSRGVKGRLDQLSEACKAKGVPPRTDEERVAILVPTWNIETWLAYLDGGTIDENRDDYPRLDRPRDCQRHVDLLHQMCQQGSLRQPCPPSLDAACEEYRARLG
jgi:hypothetical protein